MKKRVVIAGGSGFLGTNISTELLARGYEVVSLDLFPPRLKGVDFVEANTAARVPHHEKLKHPFAVINLTGRPIFARWNEAVKSQIYSSRISTTKNLVSLFKLEEFRPKVFLSASAIGFFGDGGERLFKEGSEVGQTFLAKVCRDWETEAFKAQQLGIRTCIMRNATILGKAGMLSTLMPFYKAGVGGPLGSGEQWFPWVHIHDCALAYVWALTHADFSGTVNVSAPELVRNRDFSAAFAKALRRPHFLRIPQFALRLLYGELADEILLSAKVSSRLTRELRFHFQFPTLKGALENIIDSGK